MIETRSLGRDYGPQVALHALDLHVPRGSFFGVLGPNGAGKSTLIQILCGVLAPSRGEARVGGHDVVLDGLAARRLTGLVPQEIALHEELTPRQNLQFFGRLYGLRAEALENAVARALALADLAPRAHEPVQRMSGGMKRRLNIAMGTLHSPQLLVCDEPTVGVDPQSRAHIFDCLRTMNAAGTTILYTTHYMEEVEALCPSVAIIDHGRLMCSGTLAALLAAHAPAGLALVVQGNAERALAAASAFGTAHVKASSASETNIVLDAAVPLAPLAAALAEAGTPLTAASHIVSNLEQVFLKLTGRALRDNA
jgi:ABC-2 type transport system ATP-binding protein